VVDEVLPQQLLARLRRDLPAIQQLHTMADSGWHNVSQYARRSSRAVTELDGVTDEAAWRAVDRTLRDTAVEAALMRGFAPWMDEAVRSRLNRPLRKDVRLDCDDAESLLAPHTDAPSGFIKSVIYLAARTCDASLDTLLYVPVDARERCTRLFSERGDFCDDDYRHERLEDHRLAARIPFRPNRMLSFLRSPNSLHGLASVAATAAPRYLLSLHFKYALDQ
jgi:hypothetical protein